MSSESHTEARQVAEAEVKRLQAELAEAHLRWQQLAEEYAVNEVRQRTLARLTHQLSATRKETDAARLLEEACRELFDYDAFLLDGYESEWERMHNILCLDTLEGKRQEVAPMHLEDGPSPIALKVVKEGARLLLRNQAAGADDGLRPFGDKGRKSLSLMFAPVRNGDKILGRISVQSYRENAYTQSDLDELQVTADLCGGAFDRIRTEAELHAREEQYREIVETTQEGVWVVNAEGATTFVNRRAGEMLGYGEEEILGKRAFDFMFPEDREQHVRNLAERRVHKHQQQDVRLRRKNGSALWALITSNPLHDAEGKFSGALALLTDITERKAVEEELKESEGRFQAFMGNLPGIAFVKDHQGRYLFVNSNWEKVFGRKLDTVRGLTDLDLFPGEAGKTYQASDVTLRQTKQPIQVLETVHHGAEPHTYFVSKFLMPGERAGEELTGGIAVDVTERVRAQEQLRESQARSQAILNSALDAVVTIDHEGKIVEFNPAAEKMFGHRQAEVLGRRLGEVIVPAELRDRHQTALERCAQTGEAHILGRLVELPAMRADGSVFPAELTINRVEHGSRALFTGFIRDITERKQVEAALRISEERYRTLISASVSVVWTTNAAGEFDRPQPSWEKYTGQRWAEYNGQGWAQAIHEEDRERVKEARQRAAEKKEVCHAEGRIYCAATNSWRYFVGRGVPLLNEDGTVREWIGTVTDIEDQKRAEFEIRQLNASLERRVAERTTELELTNKELESFCYSVSHDLRAPLRAIDGFSLALEEDYAPMLDAAGKNYLERVRKATKRMALLIDDLLELSRITRAELKMQDVDLTQLTRVVMEELQSGHPERQVEWTVAPRLRAQGDPRLLRVALDNLLGNAWKFTQHQPKPRIEFGVTIQGDQMVYFVRDNGAGFDMNYADKLFGVFQRLHSATDYEGTGVGLANVQRVIHRHGGHVWAEAKVNEGATFYFTLPKPEQTA